MSFLHRLDRSRSFRRVLPGLLALTFVGATQYSSAQSTHTPCTPSASAHVPCTSGGSSSPCSDPPPAGKARVYRDENGVAHIEATLQADAWRAVGYEEARDALYSIALTVKKVRGEHSRFLLQDKLSLDDLAVKYYRLHLWDALGGNQARLKNLLKYNGTDQVFDNLKAYADGVNAYREHLRVGPLNAQESTYKAWLDARGASWAYQLGTGNEHQITVFDIASYVSWFNGTKQLDWCRAKDNNPHPLPSELPQLFTAEDEPPPLTHLEDQNTAPFLKDVKFGAAGSNSFYWMNNAAGEYMQTPFRGGHVADPHQSFYSAYLNPVSGFDSLNAGKIFAQIRVCNSSLPDQEMDVFGWKIPGAAAFGSYFNRNVSVGGSQGAANTADAFLLHVNPEGTQYYSYYTHVWENLTTQTITIKKLVPNANPALPPVEEDRVVTVKRAGPFGMVLNTQVFYVEDWTGWNLGDKGPNRASPVSIAPYTLPALIAYRTQYEPRLSLVSVYAIEGTESPARALYRGAVGNQGAVMAASTPALRAVLESNEITEGPMVLCVDKNGRMFGTNSGAIPQRGDDAAIMAKSIDLAEKVDLYDQGDHEPVPARGEYDKAFDWVLDPLTVLGIPAWYVGKPRYLVTSKDWGGDWPSGSPSPNRNYKPYIYLNPNLSAPPVSLCSQEVTATLLNHPRQYLTLPSLLDGSYENPGFATLSNNEVYFAFKKSITVADLLQPGVPQPCAAPFNPAQVCSVPWYGDQIAAAYNRPLSNNLLTATAYSSRQPSPFALQKNRDIIDHLLERKSTGTPMSCEQAQSFAIDNRNYVPLEGYASYRASNGTCTARPSAYQSYPPAVLNQAELDDQRLSVAQEAERERRFFSDLWHYINNKWATDLYAHPDGSNVHLADVWVTQTHLPYWFPVLWDETTDCPIPPHISGGTGQAIDMPAHAALIDFLWTGSRMGTTDLSDTLNRFGDPGYVAYQDAVEKLEQWVAGNPSHDPSHEFRNDIDSVGAGLLLQFDLGFNAQTNGVIGGSVNRLAEGRVWTPLFNGNLRAATSRFPFGSLNDPCLLQGAPDSAGALPASWQYESVFNMPKPCGSGNADFSLVRYFQSYAGWRSTAFPRDPNGALLYDDDGVCGDTFQPPIESTHPIMRLPKPPYAAIYVDPTAPLASLQPKDSLSASDINAIVHFFLVELGGFTLQKGTAGAPSTTSKKPLVENWQTAPGIKNNPYPHFYPLTRNLGRVLLMQRLVDADEFNVASSLDVWGDIVHTVIYDFDNNLVYPPGNAQGVPCSGAGIRGQQTFPGTKEEYGFQSRVWAGGASDKTILVLWPENTAQYPETFFIQFPGTRQSGWGPQLSPHFAGMTQMYADRQLAPTHFTDYRCSSSGDPVFVGLGNPYISPP